MSERMPSWKLLAELRRRPDARAVLRGSADRPGLTGAARFYQTRWGVLVSVEASGLPEGTEPCGERVFAFHIHSGGQCAGDGEDPFAGALTHYNPDGCPHPSHAGDLPPLFSNHGRAFQVVLTDRFTVREVIGRTVILHARPDDFTTQPSGNAGAKLACGRILGGCGGI